MPLGKKNIHGNQQIPFQQFQSFQPLVPSQQVTGNNYNPGRTPQQLSPVIGGQGAFPFGQAPNYPPQGFGLQQPQQQPLQQPVRPVQGYPPQRFPSQGSYPTQGYAPLGYNQGYGGPSPVQPAWEEPKKGGIKGLINNLMAKWKR